MMRRRNSLKCSKKVIAPPGSSAEPEFCGLCVEPGTRSGRRLGALFGFFRFDCGCFGFGFERFLARTRDGFVSRGNCRGFARRRFGARGSNGGSRLDWLGGSRGGRRLCGLFALRQKRLTLQVAHFLLKSSPKVQRSFAKFGHELAE